MPGQAGLLLSIQSDHDKARGNPIFGQSVPPSWVIRPRVAKARAVALAMSDVPPRTRRVLSMGGMLG
jgi:hypothetical protein